MPDKIVIERSEIVVVDKVGTNSYGDLTFTDKTGKEYKVSEKRKKYFENVIIPDLAVELHYASYKGNEYIYSATLVNDMLPAQQAPQSKSSVVQEASSGKPSKDIPLSKDEQIEKAVWVKELGECLRSGEIDKTTSQGKAMRNAYYTEMCRVLGVDLKEVQPAKSLIEEAKRLGAIRNEACWVSNGKNYSSME